MKSLGNSYWRTTQEVESYLEGMQATNQKYACLCISFESDPAFIQRILPPCFAPSAKAEGMVSFSLNRSTLLGAYNETKISFACRYHDGTEAWYTPADYISEEYACYTAREVRGYPTKHGVTNLMTVGADAEAALVRHGIGAIERVAGDLLCEGGATGLKEESPATSALYFVNINGTFQCEGNGFEHTPAALLCRMECTPAVTKVGEGALRLMDGCFDRLSEIPVKNVGRAVYSEGVSVERVEKAQLLVDSPLQYLPYYFGTKFDNLFDIPMSDLVRNELTELYEYFK